MQQSTPASKDTISRQSSLEDDKQAMEPAASSVRRDPTPATSHRPSDTSNECVSPFTVLASYQPLNGRPYDLTNTFDRTNMALRIMLAIENREGRLASVEWMYRKGLITTDQYLERNGEAAGQLRRHRDALQQLNKLGSN